MLLALSAGTFLVAKLVSADALGDLPAAPVTAFFVAAATALRSPSWGSRSS